MAPETQNFGLIREDTVVKSSPNPQLRDDYKLVRTVAIALNPTDWTSLDAAGGDGTLVGCDYSGVILEVGKDVKRTPREVIVLRDSLMEVPTAMNRLERISPKCPHSQRLQPRKWRIR